MNVRLLLLWLATLQISATVCECLRKRQNWSLSIRFNSQLRAWVTGPGAMRGVQQVHCSGVRQLRRGLRQKDRPVTETPRGRRVFWEGYNFLNFVQHIFPGVQKFFWGCPRPLLPPIYGPAEGTIECLLFPHSGWCSEIIPTRW